jgi:hypothetical protein
VAVIAGLWRVYLPEWVIAHTAAELEVPGDKECRDVFEELYRGKVREADWRIRNPSGFRPGRRVLELRRPNLQGEFKDEHDAEGLRAERGEEAVVVLAGSPEERELSDYGRRMLPA